MKTKYEFEYRLPSGQVLDCRISIVAGDGTETPEVELTLCYCYLGDSEFHPEDLYTSKVNYAESEFHPEDLYTGKVNYAESVREYVPLYQDICETGYRRYCAKKLTKSFSWGA